MTIRSDARRYGLGVAVFGLAGAAIYLLMINVTLAEIEVISGQRAFDMRPFGYGLQEATQLLEALGEEGRRYYLTRQIPLDIVYPALLAATLISVIGWLGLRLPYSKLMRVGVLCSISAAFFDYIENLGIVGMILSWPDLSASIVYAASSASIAKSGMTVAAVTITLCLAAVWVWRIARPRRYPRFSSLAKKS